MIVYTSEIPHDQAISDSLEELNRQYTVTDFKAIKTVAYDVATIDISQYGTPTSGVTVPVFSHNLGFPPMFYLFLGSVKTGGVLPLPMIDVSVIGFTFNGTIQPYSDNNTIYVYWRDQAQVAVQSFTYLVFSNPIINS
jgi:hypothetical protein